MKKITIQVTSLIIFAVLLITACSSSSPEPVAFDIDLKEFTFTPNSIEVQVGQEVTLNLTNTGALEHELMIGQGVVKMDNRPSGFENDLFEAGNVQPEITGGTAVGAGAPEHTHGGSMVIVAPGEEASITFKVTPAMVGEWEMGCFSQLGVHYDAGMVGKFIVKP